MSLNRKMSDKHEKDLVERLGGRQTRGSGNQFANQMDGRQNHYEQKFAFAWDGKATRGKSVGVSREMWEKARLQSHGERTALPLRFYDTDRLEVGLDLVVISLDDFEEMLDALNQ
jgi:hypothetical protein